ncbi:MAG: peptide ABC transporter substrate-binding protein [Bdellovibrionales bacterium]|nr:peptide ABC transporter substrate-binding protein [Bdellovibrionales bacterium]
MKRWGLLALVFTIAISCTKKEEKAEFGLDLKETIRVNFLTEPPSLDWEKSTDTTSAFIQTNLMDGLAEYDFDSPELSVKPALAESWEASNNATKWVIKLRQGVMWNDGVELVAQHVVDGWERLLRPTTASEYAYYLFAVNGARDYNSGKIKDFSKVGVKALDKYTLEVNLDSPRSYFPKMLTHHCTHPIRLDVIAKHGEDTWADEGKIVTLGAYNLKKWDHDRIIHLERNETYYGEKAKIKNVLVYMILEQSTAVGLMDTGKLDFQYEVPKANIRALQKRDDYISIPIFGTYYYGFNHTRAPFNNIHLRKAVAQAIDTKEIETVINGAGKSTSNLIPPGLLGYDPSIPNPFNIESAKSELAAAGYGPEKPFKFTLSFNTNENHQLIGENVQAQLKKNIGALMELKNEEWKVYLKTLLAKDFDLYRLGWISDYPDPNDFASLMLSYSENNRGKYNNPKYDALVEKAASELDEQKRAELYRQAQNVLLKEDAGIVMIYSYVNAMLVSKRVKNFPVNSMYQFPLKGASLD